ncbi:MAG: hypothetical protein LKG11_02705 [Bacilli bacterium]|jgi:hypothetical protein|nr:hypothetical protein [Bacilli bacterium]
MLFLGRPYTDENGEIDQALMEEINDPATIGRVRDWCLKHKHHIKTINWKTSSLDIMKMINEQLGTSLTHNQVKDALVDIDVYPVDPDSYEWHYCLSDKWLKKSF